MNLEREVIVDLLPAYFSGEASAATRALVEDFFRENPDFEKSARSAAGPLESLKVSPPALDPEKEKLTLERARMVTETRTSFFWLAVISTLMLFLFRIQNGKIIWIVWSGPPSGSGSRAPLFIAMTVFFWLFYFYARRRAGASPRRRRGDRASGAAVGLRTRAVRGVLRPLRPADRAAGEPRGRRRPAHACTHRGLALSPRRLAGSGGRARDATARARRRDPYLVARRGDPGSGPRPV